MRIDPHLNNRSPCKRRSFALVTAVLLITLIIAGAAELTTVTATESIATTRAVNTLSHRLAVDGALLMLEDRLAAADDGSRSVEDDLDRLGLATFEWSLGKTQITVTIRDDGGKFNPNAFGKPHEQRKLERTLRMLADRAALPRTTILLQPQIRESKSQRPSYAWFDQLFTNVTPGALMRLGDTASNQRVWSDVLSFWGDPRIDVRRVSEPVLEAALQDIRQGLARTILQARKSVSDTNFLSAGLIGVPAEIRQRVAKRLVFDARRYAVEIQTTIYGDRRRWYVVAQVVENKLQVLHRSRVTW